MKMEDRLEELYANTTLSRKAMAQDLNDTFRTNLTRNAVISKVERMGLKEKYPGAHIARNGNRVVHKKRIVDVVQSIEEVPSSKESGRAKRARALGHKNTEQRINKYAVEEIPPLPSFNDTSAPVHGPITINQLNENTCRWPLGEARERPPYMYCGAVVCVVEDTSKDLQDGGKKTYCMEHYLRSLDPRWRGRVGGRGGKGQ